MSFLIGVEIDNCRIAWILNSEYPKSGQIKLTTVSENQHKAEIKFYIKKSGKKYLLCTENLTGIPEMPAGEPSIDIQPSVSGKSLNYQIYINGKLIKRSTYDLSRYLRSYKPLLILVIVLAFLGATAAIFLIALSNPKKIQDVNSEKTPKITLEQQKVVQPKQDVSPPLPETKQDTAQIVLIESEITDNYRVYFQPDSAVLTADTADGLKLFIKNLPSRDDYKESDFHIEVRGHCAFYGTEEGRAELSEERALMVFNFLKSEWGIDADSLITGAGSSEPLTLDKNEQYLNRRVDINIRGKVKIEKQQIKG